MRSPIIRSPRKRGNSRESIGGGSGYGRLFPDVVLTVSDLAWLDFVILSRDAAGQSWWGGVSGGGGWLITRDGVHAGHDRGRGAELGSEVWSNDGPNQFVIPKTAFTWIESSRPPTRDTGWEEFPNLAVYKEESPLHVEISGVSDMYTCASGTVDCTQ